MYSCWMLCLQGLWQNSHGDGESSLTTSGSLKIDLCLVLTECLSRRILRLITPAVDLIHSEIVSTSTSSFFAHPLAYSSPCSHASMIIQKLWCHEYETGSLYFGPLTQKISQFYITYYIDITCHYMATWSVQKLWIRSVARLGILGKIWKSSCCKLVL